MLAYTKQALSPHIPLQLTAGVAQSEEQAAEPALRREVACYDPPRVMRNGEGVYAIYAQWYKRSGFETSLE